MKIFAMLFLVSSICFGAELKWMNDLNEAKEYALKDKKPIIIFIHSRDCYYCPVLKKKVFTIKKVQKYLKENFILLSLDGSTDADGIEEDVNDQAPERFRTSITPAFFYIGPDEEMLSRKGKKHMVIYGYWKPQELIDWSKDAKRRFINLYGEKYK
jgi:thioredoxin-related protein